MEKRSEDQKRKKPKRTLKGGNINDKHTNSSYINNNSN